jgi:hypothetical protein
VPAPVAFSLITTTVAVNTTVTSTVTFTKAGNYRFRVTITDGEGGSTTSEVPVTVVQVPDTSRIAINPRTISVDINRTQAFDVRTSDQFGDPILSTPARTVIWSTNFGSLNAINASSVLFTAPGEVGNAIITADAGSGLITTANVSVVLPNLNNGRFGNTPTSSGSNCGFGAVSTMMLLFLLLAINFHRRRFNQ